MRQILLLYFCVLLQVSYNCCNMTKNYGLNQIDSSVYNYKSNSKVNFETDQVTNAMSIDNDSLKCSHSETENQENLRRISLMLQETDLVIDQQNDQEIRTENTILILGNAGAGKTTFAQFMATNNSELISREIGNETGEFVIEDEFMIKKISESATESFTLYPETVLIEENRTTYVSLTDTPGFSDTRSEKHEVVAAYGMKKYLQRFKSLKLALLVTYNSVQYGMNKDDFIDLLRNVNTFIKDIDRFKDSIVLIATKVPDSYRVVNGKGVLVQNKKVIDGIGVYMHNVKASLMEKSMKLNEKSEIEFLSNCIKIVNHLLEKNQDGDYKNINIFRRPSEAGPLSKIISLQDNKESLRETLLNDNNYTDISDQNIGNALSPRARNYLHCLFWYLCENIKKWCDDIFQKMTIYYQNYFENYTDIYELKSRIEGVLINLKELKEQGHLSRDITTYIHIIEHFIKNQTNDTVAQLPYFEMHNRVSDLYPFSEGKYKYLVIFWSEQINLLLNYIEQESLWYSFLINLFNFCTSYKIQKDSSVYYEEFSLNNDYIPRTLLANDKFPYYKHFNFYTESLSTLQKHKLEELKNLLTLCFQQQIKISCEENGKLNIMGYFLRISLLNNETSFVENCNSTSIKAISILAMHKVFIDSDINNDMFKGITLIISAPIWEINDQKTIDISGHKGRSQRIHKADDGADYGENGKDGIPGYPGGNGGTFYIIGLQFINGIDLKVNINGGTGGPGQSGGDGHEGESGMEGYKKFYYNLLNESDYNESWTKGFTSFPYKVQMINGINVYPKEYDTVIEDERSMSTGQCNVLIRIYSRSGECGNIGGTGGKGGVGGLGGLPGKVHFITVNEPPKFTITNSIGNKGVPGIGGRRGKTGMPGKDIMCFIINTKDSSPRFNVAQPSVWRCTHYMNTTRDCTQGVNMSRDGESNFNDAGISTSKFSKYDFSKELYQYINLLRNETDKFLIESTSKLVRVILDGFNKSENNLWHIIFLSEKIN